MDSGRLLIIRLSLHLSVKEMSEKLDLPVSTYRSYESEPSKMKLSTLDVLFGKIGVSPLFFFYGIEPIFINQVDTVENILFSHISHDFKKKEADNFSLNSVDEIIDILKKITKAKSTKKLCEKLETPSYSFYTWKSRNSIPLQFLCMVVEKYGVSFDVLLKKQEIE